MVDFEGPISVGLESSMKHHSFKSLILIPLKRETVSGGQFKWGTFLLKSNGEVQRSASSGWKSEWSRKGTSRLYCETDMSLSLIHI